VINKNIIKWEKQGDKPWKHTIVERDKISILKLEWNDCKMTIINVYIPNLKSNKAKIIKKLRDHLETQPEENNLLVIGDFNFITDEQNRFPSHADDSNLTNRWNELEIHNELVDGWRATHPNERQFTHAQVDNLERIDRIYITKTFLGSCLEWTIESNWELSDYQITTVRITKHNTPYIDKGLWKLNEDIIK